VPPPGVANTLPPDKEKGIIALLREPTVPKAAEAIGVDESTLYRWLREARREAFRHAISLTQKYAPMAIQVLMKVATDPAAGHSAKVSAATALLKFSRESIELDDLAARVEALSRTGQSSSRTCSTLV
jgi:transposase-like protein